MCDYHTPMGANLKFTTASTTTTTTTKTQRNDRKSSCFVTHCRRYVYACAALTVCLSNGHLSQTDSCFYDFTLEVGYMCVTTVLNTYDIYNLFDLRSIVNCSESYKINEKQNIIRKFYLFVLFFLIFIYNFFISQSLFYVGTILHWNLFSLYAHVGHTHNDTKCARYDTKFIEKISSHAGCLGKMSIFIRRTEALSCNSKSVVQMP